MGQPSLPVGNLEGVTLFWRAEELRSMGAGCSKLVGLVARQESWACLIYTACSEEPWWGVACRWAWGGPPPQG